VVRPGHDVVLKIGSDKLVLEAVKLADINLAQIITWTRPPARPARSRPTSSACSPGKSSSPLSLPRARASAAATRRAALGGSIEIWLQLWAIVPTAPVSYNGCMSPRTAKVKHAIDELVQVAKYRKAAHL
jgi:hypothetical protein